jgi:hypothetical protein
MLERLPIDLIVEIGILAGPDEYEELAKTSKRNVIILQIQYIAKAINSFIVTTPHEGVHHFTYLGELHSFNDLPAVIYSNGSTSCTLWYQHGKLHRDNDQPAVIYGSRTKYWYQHDKLHRDNDQPAVIGPNGKQYWYQHGEIHRDNDQPAIIYSDGSKSWYRHGKRIK